MKLRLIIGGCIVIVLGIVLTILRGESVSFLVLSGIGMVVLVVVLFGTQKKNPRLIERI